MLLFYCADPRSAVMNREDGPLSMPRRSDLVDDFTTASTRCEGPLYVIDSCALPADADEVPVAAIRNIEPYLRPKSVTAAGGYLTRMSRGVLEVLLIFRRGIWDLPKGKLDPGETVEECAIREVREELGITRVALGRSLGSTVHGYPEKGRYMVKTTHWFEMSTQAEAFRPQAEEDIEAVAWVPWEDAPGRLGHKTLRRHMLQIGKLIAGTTA